jgi:hypothetical protein
VVRRAGQSGQYAKAVFAALCWVALAVPTPAGDRQSATGSSQEPAQAGSREHCLPYRPSVVTLTGVVRRHTFAGPPGYQSIAEGDALETGFYLHLKRPVCTIAGDEPLPDRQPLDGVQLVQLVLDKAGYDRLRPRLGKQVTLRGTLFAWHTGHHHAPLLLDVERK